MIKPGHPGLSVGKQCRLLSISRSSFYYEAKGETALNLALMLRTGVRISMDGKGRFLDNICIERLWRSLKYECVCLHAWDTGSEAKDGVRKWFEFYNRKRPHSALGGKPPAVVYWQRNETTQPEQQEQTAA